MALVVRRILCTNFSFPLIQTKRYRGKINLRRPQKPHFERALVLTLTKPKFESKLKGKTRLELCSFNETKNQEIDNPYERIIAADILDYFKSSKLILFCHKNPIVGEEEAQAKRLFLKNNMQMEVFGKKTMKMALEGTPYEAVLSLIVSHNALVFSPEINIKKSLQIFKKFPSFVVLAAVLEGRFINKDELLYYSNIPNLQTAQAGLVQTLNNVGGTVVNQLNAHQNTLVAHLEERMKQLDVK